MPVLCGAARRLASQRTSGPGTQHLDRFAGGGSGSPGRGRRCQVVGVWWDGLPVDLREGPLDGCRVVVAVQGPSIPGGDHQPLRLVVLPGSAELARGRGDDAGAWGHRQLRDDPRVVPQVRSGLRYGLRRCRPRPGDKWHLDEVFCTINGKRQYLWRAVDQEGNVLDILVTSRRNAKAATRFFRQLLTGLQYVPRVLITDQLASYGVAHRRLMPAWSTVDRSI